MKNETETVLTFIESNKIHPLFQTPVRFLPNYRNPCWISTDQGGSMQPHRIGCLPYIYLAGVAKSGTTELHKVLAAHPNILADREEYMYWNRRRFGRIFVLKTDAERN